jgi:hypothetical protein
MEISAKASTIASENVVIVTERSLQQIRAFMPRTHTVTAILPCNDLNRSEAFYRGLGFVHREGPDDYRMLSDGPGGELHLTGAVPGWLTRDRIPTTGYFNPE